MVEVCRVLQLPGACLACWSLLVGCGGGAAAVAPPADEASLAADTGSGGPSDTDSTLGSDSASDSANPGTDAAGAGDAGDACSGCLHPQLVVSDGATLQAGQNVHISAAGSQSACGSALTGWHFFLAPPGASAADEQVSEVPYLSVALHQPGVWQICLQVSDSSGALSCEQPCATVQVVGP